MSSTNPTITVDGNLADWVPAGRSDRADVAGYNIFAAAQDGMCSLALSDRTSADAAIGPDRTVWFNTDRKANRRH